MSVDTDEDSDTLETGNMGKCGLQYMNLIIQKQKQIQNYS